MSRIYIYVSILYKFNLFYNPQKRFSRASLTLSRDSRLFIAPTRSQWPHASIPMLSTIYICSIAYNGHARVALFTIPLHPNPLVGSKTPRIAPHRPNIRLPTRASPTYQKVGCNNIFRCLRRECSTSPKHHPEHTGGALCKQRHTFYLDLMPPKFLFALP